MRALLMYRDRDFEPDQSVRDAMHPFRRESGRVQRTSFQEQTLRQDLELDTLLRAMAGNDEFLFAVARRAVFDGFQNDVDTILYRQDILQDCLKNPVIIGVLYDLAVEATVRSRKHWYDSHYPSSMLYGSLDVLSALLDMLKTLRGIAENETSKFDSDGFTVLFATLKKELADDYLKVIEGYLQELKFRNGMLFSAELGEWNESTGFVLRRYQGKNPSWLQRLFGKKPIGYTFELDERDEAGARILSEMRHQAINRVAVALAESAGHIVGFFEMLRTELAFYVGSLNLHSRLSGKGEPVCFPVPSPSGSHSLSFRGLYDICLSLHMEKRVVGNAVDADGKSLMLITGANQGGKSSFLRSMGLAQIMMQCGMFVGAEKFQAEICPSMFTHYKREEDSTMKSGKFDEELARMSKIIDHVTAGSIVLFNESFAATNDREGSEIARQIVRGLLEKGIKVFFVTHLFDFAHGFFQQKLDYAIFLRAERKDDGTRTFRILAGAPSETSYGEDLYREVFGEEQGENPLVDTSTVVRA